AACHVPTEKRITLQPPNIAKASAEKERLLITSKFQFHKFAKEDCLTCHVDHHKSQLGTKCLDCHNIQSWKKPRFDHDKQSDFALLGKHQEVKCQECHKPIPGQFIKQGTKNLPVIRYKPISGQCLTCHKDVHQGAFGTNCKECHTERGWKFTKDFHKNFTLTGVHYSLQCAECHRDNRKLSGLSQQCLTCHAKDDVHRGTLHDCQECHRQQFWEVATFKHSLTQFPLRGVHRTLDCMECHRTGSYKGLGSDCASCHLQEALAVTTPNHSSFGNLNSCNSCHLNQFSWK
ncbi:MAG: cytochrome c3 family protein, partial [Pseudobdellovibrionaceae bacterium]